MQHLVRHLPGLPTTRQFSVCDLSRLGADDLRQQHVSTEKSLSKNEMRERAWSPIQVPELALVPSEAS